LERYPGNAFDLRDGVRDQARDGRHLRVADDLAISVVPHEDSWKVLVMTGGPPDADRCEMIETIADRLRIQFDLKS
jgi:hypothetical protein